MNETQIGNLQRILDEMLKVLNKIEKNTQLETVEETRNRIKGFANEKDTTFHPF